MHCTTPFKNLWKNEKLAPFDELILSWNAKRPTDGKYLFYASVKISDWSPWLLFASWGSDGQSTFSQTAGQIRVYQDVVEVLENQKANGFQIRIDTEGNASLKDIYAIHVYTNRLDKSPKPSLLSKRPIELSVSGLSQMKIPHSRANHLCSPASTAAVVRYLSKQNVDAVQFAQNVRDHGFDIFGNWVLNVAEASACLGPSWRCWVERLRDFSDIIRQLKRRMPVIVSVRGPLQGSALPYANGHLIAIVGFDPILKHVICMDPAFPSDNETRVRYELSDFVEAWDRRGKIAYVFSKNLPAMADDCC